MTIERLLAAIALVGLELTGRAAAQSVAPTPTPAAAAPAPRSEPVWHNPENTPYSIVDPCGGPKELLSKINPSPCVLVLGQAQVSAGYTNINTHGSFSVTGPQRGILLPISGNANAYPGLFMAVGVSPHSQFSISLPSEVALSTQRLGSGYAATDTSFNYKQLVYFSPTKFTLAAVDLGYTAPTGTASLGPAYTIQPQLAQPLNANLTVGAYWTFKNADVSSLGVIQRAWSDPIGLYLSWSPANANFAILPWVIHEFNPNRTPLIIDGMYLINRRALLNLMYGGVSASGSTILPSAPNLTFAANVNPRIFAATLFFLVGGESNLPPMPPPAATPAP